MSKIRGYTPATREALNFLGTQIREGRARRGWTQSQLAERIGVTKLTVINIERGNPSVAVGTVFEAATLTGVVLYDPDPDARTRYRRIQEAELALLPAAVRPRKTVDDF